MSVKLGNTSIAGTQVLYSTTGNNTDGAMTQSATTTALSTKSNDIDVVHKTGTETVGGSKTFSDTLTFLEQVSLANGKWNPIGDDAFFGDRNKSGAVFFKGNNGNTTVMLSNRSETSSNGFYIAENDLNALKIVAPTQGASAWGSVTAMTAQSLGSNGYIKFNHGLIIQWGDVTVTSVPHTVNLSIAMSSYKVVATPYGTTGNNREICITGQTTTTFSAAVVNATRFFWIAIGY